MKQRENDTMLKLSKTSKMGCLSWSLQALTTCPGSKGENGELVAACSGCYATTGFYQFAPARAARAHNKQDWQRDEWVSDMVQALDNERYFRWFDSGDMYHLGLAKKILAVMQATPWVSHWLPTRVHKFSKFHNIIIEMQSLPNVVVRFSSDSVTGETIEGATTSTITPDATMAPIGARVCPAYTKEHLGKCLACRSCWDKGTQVIAYVAHGKKMSKVIRVKNLG